MKWENKGFRREMKGTRANEENERLMGKKVQIVMRVNTECMREENQM